MSNPQQPPEVLIAAGLAQALGAQRSMMVAVSILATLSGMTDLAAGDDATEEDRAAIRALAGIKAEATAALDGIRTTRAIASGLAVGRVTMPRGRPQ